MKNLFLIDANALIHRLYHALPPLTNKNGEPAGAIYGLSSVLLKIIREEKPDYIMAFFDRPEPTFRKEMYAEYKIHRPKAADDLVSQIIGAHGLFDAFQIKTMEIPGFEADDLIAGATKKFSTEKNLKITIFTGDLDLLQLVDNEKVFVKALKKGVSETATYDEKAVIERFGVAPKKLPEYKGLVGDASDNIPGVFGIGPKTAGEIIKKYDTLENFLKNGEKEKSYPRIKEHEKQAILSRNLATLNHGAEFKIDLHEIAHTEKSKETIIEFLKNQGFESLIRRVEGKESTEGKIKTKEGAKKKKLKHGEGMKSLFG